MANDLELSIDFNMKDRNFSIKDKIDGSSLFNGNIDEMKEYLEYIKNDSEILNNELLFNIEEDNIKNVIEKSLTDDIEENTKDIDNTLKLEESKEILDAENEDIRKEGIAENNLAINKIDISKTPIYIFAIAFFVIVILYIKLN